MRSTLSLTQTPGDPVAKTPLNAQACQPLSWPASRQGHCEPTFQIQTLRRLGPRLVFAQVGTWEGSGATLVQPDSGRGPRLSALGPGWKPAPQGGCGLVSVRGGGQKGQVLKKRAARGRPLRASAAGSARAPHSFEEGARAGGSPTKYSPRAPAAIYTGTRLGCWAAASWPEPRPRGALD